MKRIPDSTPTAELTVGQLRAVLRETIEQYLPIEQSGPVSGGMADVELSFLASDVAQVQRELDELGAYIEDNVNFAYKLYDWFEAGMPEEGARELAREARVTRDARRVERYARAALELREPDGTWPTQEAVAEKLTITTRALRDRRIGGWPAILKRAEELLKGPEPAV